MSDQTNGNARSAAARAAQRCFAQLKNQTRQKSVWVWQCACWSAPSTWSERPPAPTMPRQQRPESAEPAFRLQSTHCRRGTRRTRCSRRRGSCSSACSREPVEARGDHVVVEVLVAACCPAVEWREKNRSGGGRVIPRHSGDGGDGGDRPARQWEGSGRWWSRRFNASESAAGRAHDIARQHQSLSSWSAARSRPWPADRDHGAAAEPRSSAGGGGDRCRAPPALRAAQRWRVGGAEGARRLGRARATCWTRIVQLRGGAAAALAAALPLGVGGWGPQRAAVMRPLRAAASAMAPAVAQPQGRSRTSRLNRSGLLVSAAADLDSVLGAARGARGIEELRCEELGSLGRLFACFAREA